MTWKPREIIVHKAVADDPVTRYVLRKCHGVPIQYVDSGRPDVVTHASKILSACQGPMLEKILVGKGILYLAPAGKAVDTFEMQDDRMMCPHFARLKLASNGCFYQCDWCYLKLTYRTIRPFITIRTEYDQIRTQLRKAIQSSRGPVMFNSGEMADSLALEHLSRAAQKFIPWFGRRKKGYLFMLTKSDAVDPILDLDHGGHTVLAWSLNEPSVSRKYEIGAPPFERRLRAAQRAQEAGYRVRVRLDPVVPFRGWKDAYAETIERIFKEVRPERITVGTLRFEPQFYRMRETIFSSGPDLPRMMAGMEPMFEPKVFHGSAKPKAGKYSFDADTRVKIFRFVVNEIRKHSEVPVALCKESAEVWERVGLDLSDCRCVCQLDGVDMEHQA